MRCLCTIVGCHVTSGCARFMTDPTFIHFHSPSLDHCSRWAISLAFGKPYSKPPDRQPCCGYYDPDDSYLAQNKAHQNMIGNTAKGESGRKGKVLCIG